MFRPLVTLRKEFSCEVSHNFIFQGRACSRSSPFWDGGGESEEILEKKVLSLLFFFPSMCVHEQIKKDEFIMSA
jgi:hypothetical protein